jgi:hypothetical protein
MGLNTSATGIIFQGPVAGAPLLARITDDAPPQLWTAPVGARTALTTAKRFRRPKGEHLHTNYSD